MVLLLSFEPLLLQGTCNASLILMQKLHILRGRIVSTFKHRRPTTESPLIIRLPYDVLLLILEFAVSKTCKCGDPICFGNLSLPLYEGYLFKRHHPLRQHSRTKIFALMNVCSYWRNAVIESPMFWSRFDLPYNDPEFLALCLTRARDAPLDVSIRIKADSKMDIESIHRFLKSNLHRIERLVVGAYGFHSVDVIPCVPAPLLKRLMVRTGKKDAIASAHLDIASLAPGLESLTMCGCTTSSNFNILKNLKRLCLISSNYQVKFAGWSAHDVLQVLSHCWHTIEEVELDTTREADGESYRGQTTLTLPKLRRLAWRTSTVYPNLFQFISAPAIQTVQIVDVASLDADVDYILPSSFTKLSTKEPLVLEIYLLSTERRVGVNLYANLDRSEKLFASSFTIMCLNECFIRFLESLVREHGMQTVKHIRYSADSPEDLERMNGIFDLMPHCERREVWNARE